MQKVPKLVWLLGIIAGISLVLNIVTIVVAIRNPSGNSYPRTVQITQPVDYNRISNLISQKIADLPKAPAGQDGQPGLNGNNGADGIPGVTGPQGPPGKPGANAKPVELQYNPIKAEVEWRHTGDFTWRTLVTACTLTNSCP